MKPLSQPNWRIMMLQHLAQRPANKGFTLIELLVVIIIIGVLSAIALPSFLNQANRARESEAKQYIGSMNRAQQAYYLQETEFVSNANFASLGVGIATQTTNYDYVITGGGAGNTDVSNQAQPRAGASAPMRAYVGGVVLGTQVGTGEATTLAVLCEADASPVQGGDDGTAVVTTPVAGASLDCPASYKPLG